MPSKFVRGVLILMLGFALACGARDGTNITGSTESNEGGASNDGVVRRPGEPDVVELSSGDAEMDEAMNRARASLDGFLAQIPRHKNDNSSFSLKIRIPVRDGGEHVWISDPHPVEDRLSGKLANEPLEGSLRVGDSIDARREQVSDWMAIVDGRMFGGFTIFVIRERMSPSERKDFDSSLDYEIPDSPRTF